MRVFYSQPYYPAIQGVSASERAPDSLITGGKANIASKNLISNLVGGGEVFLTASCTQALEFASLLIGLEPGDEVIVPSYNFTSGVTSLVNIGAIPVFVDVDPFNLNISTESLSQFITEKTKAISFINYAGRSPDVSKLRELADLHGLFLIEDNAHGLTGTHVGKPLGSFGDVSVLSFHSTKNITCGEGGALVVNNSNLLERSYILKDKGTNRKAFLEGGVEKYQWQDKGGSYLLAEPLCEILLAQLMEIDEIQSRRAHVFDRYLHELLEWMNSNEFTFGVDSENSKHTSHIFYFMLKNSEQRSQFINYMKAHGIETPFHYQALHATRAGMVYGKTPDNPWVSTMASQTLVRLPIWHQLPEESIDYIIQTILSYEN